MNMVAEKKLQFAVLSDQSSTSSIKWISSCKKMDLNYDLIDLTNSDWLTEIHKKNYDCFLVKPPEEIQRFKELFNERLYIISKVMNKFIYPSYEELLLHENKKMLCYYLIVNNIPHPQTSVIYQKEEAIRFVMQANPPLVAKTSLGASGTGVKILKDKNSALKYVSQAFSKRGIKRRFGPNRNTGNLWKWMKKTIYDFGYFKKRLSLYLDVLEDVQKGYVIFQEYVTHGFEWRAVNIGGSYFAHKKIKIGEMASGSKGIDYVNPPLDLLNFIKDICETNNFNSIAIDIFEHPIKGYLVNEMQTIFGHVQDYILKVDGKIGRYVYDGNWTFEEGDFNTNESYDLRLQHAISLIKKIDETL